MYIYHTWIIWGKGNVWVLHEFPKSSVHLKLGVIWLGFGEPELISQQKTCVSYKDVYRLPLQCQPPKKDGLIKGLLTTIVVIMTGQPTPPNVPLRRKYDLITSLLTIGFP